MVKRRAFLREYSQIEAEVDGRAARTARVNGGAALLLVRHGPDPTTQSALIGIISHSEQHVHMSRKQLGGGKNGRPDPHVPLPLPWQLEKPTSEEQTFRFQTLRIRTDRRSRWRSGCMKPAGTQPYGRSFRSTQGQV